MATRCDKPLWELFAEILWKPGTAPMNLSWSGSLDSLRTGLETVDPLLMVVATLKIYLHDGTSSFRIQLVGQLARGDLRELNGCWRTAQSTVERRPLVVDVTRLSAADEAGIEWLATMLRAGAQILDGRELAITLPVRFREMPDRPDGTASLVQTGFLRSLVSHLQRSFAAGSFLVK